MVIDTSAIIAILSAEPEAEQLVTVLVSDPVRLMSAASLLESAMVIEARYGEPGGDKLDELVSTAQIRIEPVTVEQVKIARQAFRLYGKGRHPAALNFGDCFTYALAKILDQAVLFKGDDFKVTDLKLAIEQ